MRLSSLPTDTILQKTFTLRSGVAFHPFLSLPSTTTCGFLSNAGCCEKLRPHASTLRVDGNLEPHHHLVCSRCKSVQDIEGDFIDLKRLSRQLPDGFDLTQPLIEVFGLCRRCSAKT